MVAALLSAGCGPPAPPARRCLEQADCPGDTLCRAGRCVAGQPPVAVVAPPGGALLSHTVLRFDGSASSDPDPEDRIAAFAWTLRRSGAACDPWPASGSEPAVEAVFPCAGTFAVELVVTDGTGRASAPAALDLPLDASPNAPSVTMGADLARDHACGGAPLLCTPVDAGGAASFQLSATAASPVSDAFTYAWSWRLPPELEGKPAPRVVLDPPDGPAPAVRIETDGTAISGEYVFTVRATDAWHLVAVGEQRVAVGNRPPEVAGGGTLSVPHGYDAAGKRFLASGTVPSVTWSDPDGDPVSPLGFTASHAGDGPSSFTLSPTGASADFAIAVPYTEPSNALWLIGGPGLSRSVAFEVADANGALALARWEVQVTNRAPRRMTALAAPAVDHAYDAPGARYLAAAPLATYADEDGDPVVQAGPTGDAVCASLAGPVGSGPLSVECSLPYAGVPSAHVVAGPHGVQVVAGDPFVALAPESTTVTVLNRKPAVAEQFFSIPADSCPPPPCCLYDAGHVCIDWTYPHGAGSTPVAIVATDGDGDPVRLTFTTDGCAEVSPPALECVGATCAPATGSLCAEPTTACGVSGRGLLVEATDGRDADAASVTFAPDCAW
jgi:hypothetical protein